MEYRFVVVMAPSSQEWEPPVKSGRFNPAVLMFPSLASPFADNLYVVANNRDGGLPGDLGGAILVVDELGNVQDFTDVPPVDLEEPSGGAFAPGDAYGIDIYVTNPEEGLPGQEDLFRVDTNGDTQVFVGDLGFTPRSVAFGLGGDFGTDLYFSDTTSECLRSVDPGGIVSEPLVSFTSTPWSIAFGTGGEFGTNLYAAIGDSVYEVTADGVMVMVATGFSEFWLDSLEFSHDCTALFVADRGGDAVYRLTATPSLELTANCPRRVDLSITGTTPNGVIRLYGGPSEGAFTLPNGPCAGTEIGIEEATLLFTTNADNDGARVLSREISEGACGLFLQTVDETTCRPSDVVQVP